MEIIQIFQLSALEAYVTLVLVAYGAVAIAMAVDFVTGVTRAAREGIATRSRGYKMTCDKAVKYFLPMFVLTCVDLIGAVVLPLPAFTMLMGAFNIFCDWRSVMESTRDKQEIREAASTFSVIVKNKDEIAGMLAGLLEKMSETERKGAEDEAGR